jgi:hypothetical protein
MRIFCAGQSQCFVISLLNVTVHFVLCVWHVRFYIFYSVVELQSSLFNKSMFTGKRLALGLKPG